MRLYSPVPGISRKLTQPLTLEGVELLPGTAVVIGLYAMHHNPAVWGDDHMEYKPERFLPENMANMDSYAYCPFAAGPRYVSRLQLQTPRLLFMLVSLLLAAMC